MLLKNVYLCLLLEGKANEEVYEKDRIVVDCRDDDFTGDGSGFFRRTCRRRLFFVDPESGGYVLGGSPFRFQHSGFGGYSFEQE